MGLPLKSPGFLNCAQMNISLPSDYTPISTYLSA